MKNCKLRKYVSLLLIIAFSLPILQINMVQANTEGTFNLSVLESEIVNSKKGINLSWDQYQYLGDANTKYTVARKNLNTGKWELRGKYEESVKVLNVYPNRTNSGKLDDWMESLTEQYSNVHIEVDKVKIEDFNELPSQYLYKDKEGYYNYDVVVFGFWDSNNYQDISTNASDEVQKFIDSGGGALFGHDTVQYVGRNPRFLELLTNNLDIIIRSQNMNLWTYSTLVKVKKQGAVTTYPFDINEEELIIPMSHALGQLPVNEDEIYITFEKNYYPEDGDGPYFYPNNSKVAKDETTTIYDGKEYFINSYLTMGNGVGFIQCGHSSGKTSLAEQKILANSIYALASIHYKTEAVDQIIDEQRPTKPTYEINGNEITFNSSDEGNGYRYRIIAVPLGDESPTLTDELINALETSDKLNERMVFSNSVDVWIGGQLKEFQYIINKNSTEHSINDGEALGVQSTTTSLPYKYYEFNEPLAINNDEYMHVISVDQALNTSDILTIDLMQEIPEKIATVRFENVNGEEIKPEISTNMKYGLTFSPNIEIISNYIYKESVPSESLYTYNEENIITHVYDEPVSRDLYVVEHKDLEIPEVINSQKYTTMSNMMYNTVSLLIPSAKNHTFLKYYTENTEISTPVSVIGNFAEVVWNRYPLFAHYRKNTDEATVKFIRSTDKVLLGEYSKEWYIEEIANMKGTDISTSANIQDLDAYINKIEVSQDRQQYINTDEQENIIEVELVPRSKEVMHYGVDFTNNLTSTTSVELQPNADIYTYSGDVSPLIDLKYDGVDGWKVFDGYIGEQLDFTNPTKLKQIGYYKGILPSESYEFKVDYINEQNGDVLNSTYSSPSIYNGQKVEIPFEHTVLKSNYNDTNRDVEFIATSIEIINDTTLEIKTFDVDEDYTTFFPELDYDGTYSIKVLYTPISQIKYIENVDYANSTQNISEHMFNVHMGEIATGKVRYPVDKFKVTEVIIDGDKLSLPEAYDFTLNVTDYNHIIEVTYEEKSYNLTVNQISKAEQLSKELQFENIPIGEVVDFNIQPTNGYHYINYEGEDREFASVENNVFTFKSLEEGNYSVDLNYKKESILTTSYYFINGDKIVEDLVETWYIGDDYKIIIPTANPKEYEVAYAYADGKLYEGVQSGDEYIVTITKPAHNLKLIYRQNPIYNLTILVNEEEGSVGGEGVYFDGQEVFIEANANPEYEFKNWTYVVQNGVIIEDVSNPHTYVTMTNKDVTIQANFVKIDDEDNSKEVEGSIDENTDSTGSDKDKTTSKSKGGSNVKEEEEEQELDYKYKPYIVGYEDGTVKPSKKSERIEFIRMIYNLLAPPNVEINKFRLEKYSDVTNDAWYSNALAFCINIGIVSGFEDKTIRPNNEITRGEVAVMIVKIMDYVGREYTIPTNESTFLDSKGHWAENYINILYYNDIAYGMPNGNFNPDAKVSRAEIVAFINRVLSRDISKFEYEVQFIDLPKDHWAYKDMMNAANGFNPEDYEIQHVNN